ncbi:MAG TPA: Gfo/Idh/MocA family oxidoreductase [Gaiellaceae bacterium]|nr:Gfo/Idh/MocA family oxidoreductase [Gaiellaceae bacterium]
MLRLGLLSTANINRRILAAAASGGDVSVVAVGSRDRERATAYAREHGLERAHGSYDALLADEEVDAVYVSLPNGLHHEWTLRALRAGKHVLCEKPYSRHPAEVEEAFALAERSGLVLTEAFMYRHHPQTGLVAGLVRDGAIGRPRLLRAAFSFVLASLEDVRADPALDGGSLMDLGCYCVSAIRLLGGEPESVVGEQALGPTGVDMSFEGELRLAGGAVGSFRCSFTDPQHQELEIVGEEGTLRVQAPWRVDWGGDVLVERGGEMTRVDVPDSGLYEAELANLADAAAGVAEPLLGREDALGQARAIDGLYRSADEEGRPVEL